MRCRARDIDVSDHSDWGRMCEDDSSKPTVHAVQRKMATPAVSANERLHKALEEYRKKLIEHRELDAKLKKSESS